MWFVDELEKEQSNIRSLPDGLPAFGFLFLIMFPDRFQISFSEPRPLFKAINRTRIPSLPLLTEAVLPQLRPQKKFIHSWILLKIFNIFVFVWLQRGRRSSAINNGTN